MNYIKLIRHYWDEAPYIEGYKSDYTTLFFAIVDEINKNNWKETAIEYGLLIEKSKIGKRMYLDGREWLNRNGFISFTAGKGDYSKARFSINNAVQYAVQKCTTQKGPVQSRTAQEANAVQNYTASNTASEEDRCKNAPHTAPHTAPINKGINLKTFKLNSNVLFANAHNTDIGAKNENGILSSGLKDEEKKEPSPVPPPPSLEADKPLKPFAEYDQFKHEYRDGEGDGRLHQMLREFWKANPNAYPAEMFKAFKQYWTAKVITGKKSEIGKERWEIEKTWSLSGRLATWNRNNQQSNGNYQRSNQSTELRPTAAPVKPGGHVFGEL